MSTTPADAVRYNYGKATSALIEMMLNELAAKDPTSGANVLRTLMAGGFVTLSTSASPLTGAMACNLTITELDGRLCPLGSIEFDTPGNTKGQTP